MKNLNLLELTTADARLVQYGLEALGHYSGTKRGMPGPLTIAAYNNYLKSIEANAPGSVAVPGDSLADRLVKVLLAEVGVKESPKNSNTGKRVQEYQAATWLSGTGWAWCAAFICWGLKQIHDETPLPFPRPKTAGAWDFENWARNNKLVIHEPRKTISKGDIVIFYPLSHIGVAVEDEKDGYVQTVEGNTDSSGSREGGGVYTQKRKVTMFQSHIPMNLYK